MAPIPSTRSTVLENPTAKEQERAEQDEAFLKDIQDKNVTAIKDCGRKNSDLNIVDKFGSTAVHHAARCEGDNIVILEHLIKNGAYVEHEDRDGARPIAHAIRWDNIAAVEMLLGLKNKDGSRVVDLKQKIHSSAHSLLHEAAWYDRAEVCELLFKTGAFTKDDLALENKSGQSVMHVAVIRARPEFLELLVANGGDVDAPCNANGRFLSVSPAQLATNLGKPANAKLLGEMSVAIQSIRFATKMKAKRKAAHNNPAAQPSVLHMKLDYDLKLFTADLENAFIAKLAKHADIPPSEVLVLCKTAGSVILELELRGANAPKALAKMETSGEEELSEVLGYKVVSRSVGPRSGSAVGGAEASDPSVKSPRATPGYNPSPAMARANK